VCKLSAELAARGIKSKQRVSRTGVAPGGVAYSRGALYALLKNRLYLGEIAYRWQPTAKPAVRAGAAAHPVCCWGWVYDEAGARYTPAHAQKLQALSLLCGSGRVSPHAQ